MIQRHPFKTTFIAVASAFVVLLIVGLHYNSSIRNSVRATYWIAVLTGSWATPPSAHESPQNQVNAAAHETQHVSDDEYIIGSVVAIVLNLAAYGLIFQALRKLIQEGRRKAMDVAAAMQLGKLLSREAAEELTEKRFPASERDKVLQFFDDALAEGGRLLARHLPNVDPERGAELLNTITVSSRHEPH